MIISAYIVNGNTLKSIFLFAQTVYLVSLKIAQSMVSLKRADRISVRKLRDGIKTTTWNSSKFRAKVLLFGIHENKIKVFSLSFGFFLNYKM